MEDKYKISFDEIRKTIISLNNQNKKKDNNKLINQKYLKNI